MSHSQVIDCSNSGGKGDDTLIIIVNSDGTLSVDPETLQKLLANQHQTSPISLVHLDSKGDAGSGGGDDDNDPDSHVNLTVEGYYPPTPAPSSPTPPPTPVSETNISPDGVGSDVLADSITEILQPEDVEKLETALQSEHAKEILGDVVLDMLQKNGEEGGLAEEVVMSKQGSVVLDHCYASLTGPTPATPVAVVVTSQPQPPTRGTARVRGGVKPGRGRGSQAQAKFALLPGTSMVPVVKQLVMPGSPGTVTVRTPSSSAGDIKTQATVSLQRINLQHVFPNNVTTCKVMLSKVPDQVKPSDVASPLLSGAGGDTSDWKPTDTEVVVAPKKRATTRGGRVRGMTRGVGRGRGRPLKVTEEEEARNKQLAEEMAATVRALTLAEQGQLAQLESMEQNSDSDRVIPLVNKAPAKKAIKVYRRALGDTPKTLKVLKPEKPKPVARKSLSSESSSQGDKAVPEPKKEEKVIVVSMEPQITPSVVSAVVMSQSHPQPVVTPSSVPTPTAPTHRKNYPKRENRKPPAHLVEAFQGPALFSTPDIIRRVSTDKSPSAPTTPSTPLLTVTPTPLTTQPVTSTPASVDIASPVLTTTVVVSATSKLEDELGLVDSEEALEDTISTQVSKQEDQLMEEALLLEDMLQGEVSPPQPTELPSMPPTVNKPPPKTKKQTSLSTFFSVVNQTKEEPPVSEIVDGEGIPEPILPQITTPGGRKLPPVELPATRGATKRASLMKDHTPQEVSGKKPEVAKQIATSVEKRKSTDSKKSTESRKSLGRSLGEDSEDMLGSDDGSDEDGSVKSEDDPNRLWCICKRPHNNRFMICCDFCEDWFHGKCVGITKAMGEQMEEKEIEWMCPNCKKKKKQEEAAKKQTEVKTVATPPPSPLSPKKALQSPPPVVSPTNPTPGKEKKVEASKVMVQQQKLVMLGQETPKSSKGNEIRITKVASRKSVEDKKEVSSQPTDQAAETNHPPDSAASNVECIVCKKEALAGGVYCSDECIAEHTKESLAMIDKSAVIVFEKKTGRIYGGANAPTASTLTSWLMAHPSYQVMRPGVLPSAKFYNKPQPLLRQTVLQTKPQGIQLIAALPQPPPIEGPLKKNLAKAELTPTPKTKPQSTKGQQQITSLLKVHPKSEAVGEAKPITPKAVAPQGPSVAKKTAAKEMKKTPQQPVPKKVTPTVVKKPVKEEPKVEQKREEARSKQEEEQNVRASVKKTLQEVLSTRLQETSDLKLSDDQIKKLTTQIEEELYSLFKDTSAKYKAKYRSLMFNIKDKNNLTLFRKIADKSISPVQLVRLSPEELASQELAQWREREARHQLEMIKKTELDLMQQAKTVVMKTHKGEQVVENELGIGGKVIETTVEIEPVTATAAATHSTDLPKIKPKEDASKSKEDKQSKKDKKEDKHKDRRHSTHKSSHQKEHDDRSRSRHRSRHRSESDQHSKTKSKPPPSDGTSSRSESIEDVGKGTEPKTEERDRSNSRPPDRSRSRHREERSKSKPPTERGRSKSRHRERSKSRPRERSKSRPRERSKSKPRERSKSRPRERSKSRPRERSKSKDRSKSRPRERSKSAERGRSKSQQRSKSQTRSRSKSRTRSKSQVRAEYLDIKDSLVEENTSEEINMQQVHEDIDIPPIKPAIFDAEIKEIIKDVVVQEEIGVSVEEDLSDREPSSTVNISTPPFNAFEEEEIMKSPVWKGTLLMPDVAKFSTSIQEVSGICGDLEYDLPETIIECVGRISPEIAWDYIAKMKKSGTKQILVVRFSSDNEEDKMSYLSFYSYLSSRNRLGVVRNNLKMIKDFYILPLPSHSPVPQVLLPLDGPGFEDYRPHLLLGIIVRSRRKRMLAEQEPPSTLSKVPKKSERSYTPPLPDEGSHTPTQPLHPVTESFTPPHSPQPLRIIKLKASNSPLVSEMEDGDTPYTPEDDADTPYSPGDADSPSRPPSPGCSAELQRKVDQLNRMINDIEQKKQKIDSLTNIAGMSPPQDVVVAATQEDEEDEIEEAYSPSGSLTPPPTTDTTFMDKSASKISLPSEIQDIIASIKKKPDEPKSLDLKSDPIVQAYRETNESFSPEEDRGEHKVVLGDKEVTPPQEEVPSLAKSISTAVKVNRDPRQRPQLSLNQLSDEDIMKKASEMGFMNPENPEPIPDSLKSRTDKHEEEYDPFAVERDTTQNMPPLQSSAMPSFMNQPLPFNPDFPPPPRPPPFATTSFPAPGTQFQPPHMFQSAPQPPLPPIPPSHIPFTNPQPPPPVYPPPPPPIPAPPIPPPPSESPEVPKKKFSKKSKKKSRDPRGSRKEKREKRKYSESPPPKKDYSYDDSRFDKARDRDRYSSKKRDKKDNWRTYDSDTSPDKRRDSWDYEAPPVHSPPTPTIPIPPPHAFGMPGPMRGGLMRGRFMRGMRGGFRRGFDRPPMRGGFHRGGFVPRGHRGTGPPPPVPGRSFSPKNIHSEFEEDIRRFEEQRLKQKSIERKRWRNESPPRKRRNKEDSD